MNSDKPLALSVEQVRHEMLRGILIPRDIVNRAIQTTVDKLEAKETKFFSYKGVVVSQRDVDAHGAQLQAADTIFSLAGLYAREREAAPQMPHFEITISPNGVMKLSSGSPTMQALPLQEGDLQVNSGRESLESTLPTPTIIDHAAPMAPRSVEPHVSYDEIVE